MNRKKENSPVGNVVDRIYLDHNATTPLAPEVCQAMSAAMEPVFGNPSSIHDEGRRARAAIDSARRNLASLVGAKPAEIFFTSGGTEADNLAVVGCARKLARARGGRHLITSSIEHPAVAAPFRFLAENEGFELTVLGVDSLGLVSPEDLKAALRPGETILVSIIAANNEIGTIQPIEELGRLCREAGTLFHSDAIQALGKIPFKLDSLPVDLASFSAHKIYGPKGAGALYVRKGCEPEPLVSGGGQERKIRSGTENLLGIVGFGTACEVISRRMDSDNGGILELRELFEDKIFSGLDGVTLNGHPGLRLPNTVNLSFAGVEGEALLLNLDLEGVSVSSGSACASGSLEPSPVLTAIGLASDMSQGSVRFSLGRDNDEEQILFAVEKIISIVKRLRSYNK